MAILLSMRTPGIAVAITLVTFALPVRAESAWFQPPRWYDVALLAAAETLIVVDILQTSDMTTRPRDDFREMNPLLGNHPSRERVILAGAGAALGTAALWYALPSEWRPCFVSGVIALEIPVVWWNARAGLTIHF